MLTLNELQTILPEFANATPAQEITLNAAIAIANVTSGGYLGLPESIRNIAIAYQVAGYVAKKGYFDVAGGGQVGDNVKKYKSYNDEIEYFERSAEEKTSVQYSDLLEDLIEQYGFPTATSGSCGCDDLAIREVW